MLGQHFTVEAPLGGATVLHSVSFTPAVSNVVDFINIHLYTELYSASCNKTVFVLVLPMMMVLTCVVHIHCPVALL